MIITLLFFTCLYSLSDNFSELETVVVELQEILVANESETFPEWEVCAYVLAQAISAMCHIDRDALSKNRFNYQFFFDILK